MDTSWVLSRPARPSEIEQVVLANDGFLAEALAHPYLSGMSGLSVSRIADDDAEILAHAPSLNGLRFLRVDGVRDAFTARGVGVLCGAAFFPELDELWLANNPIGDAGAELLASVPFRALRILKLARCELGPSGLRALAGCRALRGLIDLDINDNPVTAKSIRALAIQLPDLRRIGVQATGLTKYEEQDWYDYDGSYQGSGPSAVGLTPDELRRELRLRPDIYVY